MHLSNQNRGIANFARGSKAKSKLNEQENKGFEEESEKRKWQKKEKCHYCGKKHPGDCWHLKTKSFFCQNVGHIAVKYSEKSGSSNSAPFSSTPKSQSRNMTCVTKKISPESKTKVDRILVSYSVTPRPKTTLVTSVIIDSWTTDHFCCNRDLISSYTKCQHEFEKRTSQRIIAHRYCNVILRMFDMSDNFNTLTVSNVSWTPELGHNLLSTLLLAKKGIEVFLRKESRPSEIYFEEEIFGFIDIVDN